MADTTPLSEVIARYADEKMFAAIAREYKEGRLLLIGTTNLDAQRPVIWNIGALAASGKPGRTCEWTTPGATLDCFNEFRASRAMICSTDSVIPTSPIQGMPGLDCWDKVVSVCAGTI